PFTVSLGGREYLSLAGRFPGNDRANVTYLIQQSLSDALQPYRETQQLLLRIGLIGLLSAALVSYAVASGIAQPLLRIVGAAEAALRSTRSLTEYERVLQSILEETERMAHIVDQLLVLARADSGELTLDCSPLPLHDLLLELQQPASILGRQQGVDLAFAIH